MKKKRTGQSRYWIPKFSYYIKEYIINPSIVPVNNHRMKFTISSSLRYIKVFLTSKTLSKIERILVAGYGFKSSMKYRTNTIAYGLPKTIFQGQLLKWKLSEAKLA